MDGFARKLNKRRPKEDYSIDWEGIVEDLSGIVIDTHRKGESEITLADVPVDEKIRWRVDNLLVESDISLLWADGGTGKSFFALFLGTLIQQGYMSSEHGLIVEPGNVLFLDYETSATEIAVRAKLIQTGLNIDTPDATKTSSKIIYRRCDQPFAEEVDRIRDIIHNHSIDVVIIDSMGMAVGGDIQDAFEITHFFRELRKLKKTVLVISHANRQGTFFGSAYTYNSSRLVWEAKRSGSNETGMDFSLFCRKANNVSMQPPQSWSVEFKDNTAVVYTRGDVFATDTAGELSYRDLVYRILSEEGGKTKEYIKESIKAIKGDPPERIDRNVDVAISKHKAAEKIVETDGIFTIRKSESKEEWKQI